MKLYVPAGVELCDDWVPLPPGEGELLVRLPPQPSRIAVKTSAKVMKSRRGFFIAPRLFPAITSPPNGTQKARLTVQRRRVDWVGTAVLMERATFVDWLS